MSGEDSAVIIRAIRIEIEQAADAILSAAEGGLRQLEKAREGQAAALDSLEQGLCAILEACAFQDLVGQRLCQLETATGASPQRPGGADPLLNGPAATGEGLDQAAADALMQTAP